MGLEVSNVLSIPNDNGNIIFLVDRLQYFINAYETRSNTSLICPVDMDNVQKYLLLIRKFK